MDGDRLGKLVDLASVREAPDWRGRLSYGDRGLLPTIANAMIILGNDPMLKGMLAYNEFVGDYVITRPAPTYEDGATALPGPYPRAWLAEDTVMVLGFFQRVWCPRYAKQAVEDAMVASAATNRFHPVRDWLDGLVWDGIPRLDEWLSIAFGCPKDGYHAAVGAKFLIAAVRRIRRPGCKFDSMPVLEGDQDIGKSTACKELFGEDWFSDSLPHDLSSKDAAQGLTGKWGIELGELDSLIRSEVETVKAFLSRATDRYRPPYGKTFIERPRQGVLVGTTNETDYLRDSTGNRRFWPVRCEFARHAWIREFRAQLWAEAVRREAAGESVWLEQEGVRRKAATHQADRLSEDVWATRIRSWIIDGSRSEVRTEQVLQFCIGIDPDKQDRRVEMRVAKVLRAEGWRPHVQRPPGSSKASRSWFAPGAELPGTGGKRVPVLQPHGDDHDL